jgi:hypothetical protein
MNSGTVPAGSDGFTSMTKGMRWILAIVRRSERPLDIRRIHNAAASVGLLLGRGIFGLEKHLKLSADEAGMLRDEMEETIQNGAEGPVACRRIMFLVDRETFASFRGA